MRGASIKLFVLVFFLTTIGCGFRGYQEKEDARSKAAITAVQQSESTFPGVDTTNAIAGLLATMESRGKYVKINGWSCDKNMNDSNYDVWFTVTINDVQDKYHWVVKGKEVMPANELAQAVTKRIIRY
ncbi:hypothetical protein EG829_00625 [bacterium]|nr:hypothetical protein [bacterium]